MLNRTHSLPVFSASGWDGQPVVELRPSAGPVPHIHCLGNGDEERDFYVLLATGGWERLNLTI